MSQETPSAFSRREFAAALALLAAAPFASLADEKPLDPLIATADALAAAVKARFGHFLSAEQLLAVERSVRGGVLRAASMKKVPLTNGDEPACAFSADV